MESGSSNSVRNTLSETSFLSPTMTLPAVVRFLRAYTTFDVVLQTFAINSEVSATFHEKNVSDRREAKAFRLEVVILHSEGTEPARKMRLQHSSRRQPVRLQNAFTSSRRPALITVTSADLDFGMQQAAEQLPHRTGRKQRSDWVHRTPPLSARHILT
ncbi:hypothetical protein K0M31_002361 [Melipona bicolor]|uniref:Uncharacterized protein n=1 Tax=Melipona bicolor TaxID=60889 RepID=A0AA40KZ40_9HYME|nr:hypothetical protein K0M31_002361 [Melipona bicolor]